ncbi:hypothetical protein [Streptomyces spectabilis]|uniref:Uncharacterized protein n=1 Tax=Streptomyces spectabilis TaxID=68270 RepID=A0A516RA01_STRST|nr:hypothetical protein [Streptomyces spectabilis]QDQ12482.1 hypothetical protein FH965_19555 [Streptomyces spectabilis]
MDLLTDDDVRAILAPHAEQRGAVGRLYDTGTIDQDTTADLGALIIKLCEAARFDEADKVGKVLGYAEQTGEREPVPGWARG